MKKNKEDCIIALREGITRIQMSEEALNAAKDAAMWVTASPHEWKWSIEDQVLMARYVLWAYQRLLAISDLVLAPNIPREGELDAR